MKRAKGRTSMLNNDGIDACGFLEIFMTRKVLSSFLEVPRDSTMEQEKKSLKRL